MDLPAELHVDSVKKFQTTTDLAKSYRELEGKLGKRGAYVPAADAKPEEWDAYHKAIGVPEKPDAYAYKAPQDLADAEIEETAIAAAREVAHREKLTPKQFQALVEFNVRRANDAMKAATDQANKELADTVQTLKTRWGQQYDNNLQAAGRMAQRLGLSDVIKELGLGAHLPLIEALHAASANLPADDHVEGRATGAGSVREEMARLKASKAYQNGHDPAHAETMARVRQLYQQLYG